MHREVPQGASAPRNTRGSGVDYREPFRLSFLTSRTALQAKAAPRANQRLRSVAGPFSSGAAPSDAEDSLIALLDPPERSLARTPFLSPHSLSPPAPSIQQTPERAWEGGKVGRWQVGLDG